MDTKKEIKCVLLKNQYWLISEIEELFGEIDQPNCRLIRPYQIDIVYDYGKKEDEPIWIDRPLVATKSSEPDKKYEIYPWKEFTNDDSILLFSDYIVTIVEPKPELLEAYLQSVE